ncbi:MULTISPECIES: YnfA family protein [Calothrix]|nr:MULTISPECIES: YnfA family protein [Calothrix]
MGNCGWNCFSYLWNYSHIQPANFGRVYAAYGGVFIVMAMLWGWRVDGVAPDIYDLIGAYFSLISVFVIMYGRSI